MRKTENLASRLRHRITLQAQMLTEGEGGQYAEEWQDVATVWAEVTPLENRSLSVESLFAEQLMARGSHSIVLRWRGDVTAQMRVAFGGRHFDIRSVVDVAERGECLRLLVEENGTE